MIRELQDWLLKVDPTKVAVLPDDKIQRILVGVGSFSLNPFKAFQSLIPSLNIPLKPYCQTTTSPFLLCFRHVIS